MPPAFFLSAQLVHRLAPDAEGHGTEKVIEAVNKSSGKIDAAVVLVKAITTIVTIAAGGSLGKEVPCAQIGAGLASVFAGLLLIGMTLLFSRSYLGMGLDSIEDSLNGESQPSYAFFLKAVFTSLTQAFGGSGGIISI